MTHDFSRDLCVKIAAALLGAASGHGVAMGQAEYGFRPVKIGSAGEFGQPTISSSGLTAYTSGLGQTVWAESPGAGGSAPIQNQLGLAGGTILSFARPIMNTSGDVAYLALGTMNSGGNPLTYRNDRLYRWTGTTELVAAGGLHPLPGFPLLFNQRDVLLYGFTPDPSAAGIPFAFSSAGVPTVYGRASCYNCGIVGAGLWRGVGSSLSLVIRDGQGGLMAVQPFDETMILATPSTNVLNTSVFYGRSSATAHGIWQVTATGAITSIQEGSAAPGAHGATFSELNFAPVINNDGTIAFYARLNNGGGGIWKGTMTSLTPVAMAGSVAPGAGGAVFNGFGDPVLNASGDTAFVGYLAGTGVDASNDFGIWVEGPSGLVMLAREGSPAPGTGPTGIYTSPANVISPFNDPFMNSAGDVFFGASWDNVEYNAGVGIWRASAADAPALVVSSEQTLEVTPGDTRRIIDVGFAFGPASSKVGGSQAAASGGEDGRGNAVNDGGMIAFTASFDDSTGGVFVASPLTCPADLTGDGAVDGGDLLVLLAAFGPCPPAPMLCPADITGDGAVDGSDLANLLSAFGPCP